MAFDEVIYPILANRLNVGWTTIGKKKIGHILDMRWSGSCSILIQG